jgi:hypothetical protein
MLCLKCGHIYHANGTDICQRKCLLCQGVNPSIKDFYVGVKTLHFSGVKYFTMFLAVGWHKDNKNKPLSYKLERGFMLYR